MTIRFSNQIVAELIQPFWAAWQAGEFMTDASAVAGTYRQLGLAWVRQAGGVRPRRNGLAPALEAAALLVAFQFAATWIGMYLGLIVGNEQTAAQLSILVFPFTMISNVFVPTAGMPTWLHVLANWNPLSALSSAARTLFGNPTVPTNGAWPLEHPVIATLAWTAILLAVFVPLCSTRYARRRT